jgi:manganese oxidase
MITRRQLLKATTMALGASGILAAARRLGAAPEAGARRRAPEGRRGSGASVVTPNGSTLPWRWEDGCKTFHLTAEPVKREFAPGLVVNCWGYNGQTPGPTIEAVEGDRVRIYVTNRLPEPTSLHWHGVLLPNGMDGVSGLNQKAIAPGQTYKYEFTLRQHGTQMYHPHFDEMVQMAMGMMGMFVIHPRVPEDPPVDRDFAIMLSEWFVKPGSATPDPTAMSDFNLLTFNSRVFPGTDPLVVRRGQRVRIRIGNLSSMDAHPIHLHGYNFRITGTDGGQIPRSAQWPETTVMVPVGSTRDIQFTADAPGDWALHCHITHHVMNQMGHRLTNLLGVKTEGLDEKVRDVAPRAMLMGQTGMGEMMDMVAPRNSIPMMGGVGPFGRIDMGGMFTVLKVREGITHYEDPGWYRHPARTRAEPVEGSPGSEPALGVRYMCPMHRDVVQDGPGECPKCGMTLVPRASGR